MRIKKDFILYFLLIIAALSFVFLYPAFADMKKVDESELARTNASVTGASVNNQVAGVEKGVANTETWKTSEIINKGDVVFSPSVNVQEITGLDLNIRGQKTFQFYFGGSNTAVTGGVTSVKSY